MRLHKREPYILTAFPRTIMGVALPLAMGIGVIRPTIVAAQTPLAAGGDSAQRASRKLFTKRDIWVSGAFVLTTVAMFPLDKHFAQVLQEPSPRANHFLKNASTGFQDIASPGAYFIGGSLYLVGRIGGFGRMADIGWHGGESVLLADGLTDLIKMTAGRARPYLAGTGHPDDFSFGKGLHNGARQSFPSGHTSTAFAAASSTSVELTQIWPHEKWLFRTVLYGGAGMVGLSRMYNNDHWASDVALGALIGTFSGWKVVQYSHDHPGDRLDRIMLGTKVAPTKHGLTIGWSSGSGSGASLVSPAGPGGRQ